MILPVSTVYVDKNKYSINKNNILFTGKEKIITQSAGYLASGTRNAVLDIVTAYKDIALRLTGQTENALKELSLPEFNPVKGLTFYNAGGENRSLNITMPKHGQSSNLLRIFLKNTDTQKVEKSFLILNGENVVCNFPQSAPEKIPENLKYYGLQELNDLNINSEIMDLIDLADPLLLKLRRSLIDVKPVTSVADTKSETAKLCSMSYVNSDLNFKISTGGRPRLNHALAAGFIDESSSNLIDTFIKKTEAVKKAFSTYTTTTGERIKRSYEDLVLRENKSTGYTFKNLGENQETVTVQKVINKKHGELIRLVIENNKENSVKFYLFSQNRLVKNTNSNFPYFVPDTLKYYSQDELKSLEPIFNKYFKLYNEKLADFENYVIHDLRPNKRKPKTDKPVKKTVMKKQSPVSVPPKSSVVRTIVKEVTPGEFDAVTTKLIHESLQMYKTNSEIHKKYSPVKINIAKKLYGDLELGGKVLMFKIHNNPELYKIGITPMKKNTAKITLYRHNAETPEMYLVYESKIVSNYRENSSNIPQTFKYATQDDVDKSGLSGYIKILHAKMADYTDYISAPENWDAKLKPSLKKNDFIELVKNSINLPNKDKQTPEFNELLFKCFEDFNKTVKSIQEKIDGFLKQNI